MRSTQTPYCAKTSYLIHSAHNVHNDTQESHIGANVAPPRSETNVEGGQREGISMFLKRLTITHLATGAMMVLALTMSPVFARGGGGGHGGGGYHGGGGGYHGGGYGGYGRGYYGGYGRGFYGGGIGLYLGGGYPGYYGDYGYGGYGYGDYPAYDYTTTSGYYNPDVNYVGPSYSATPTITYDESCATGRLYPADGHAMHIKVACARS